MPKKTLLVPVLLALLAVGASSFASGGGGGGGGGGGHGGGGGNSGAGSQSSRSDDSAKGRQEQHKSGMEREDAKGKHASAEHQLESHSKLAERLSQLSGMSATELKSAAAGFKNFGQFVAAVHVSKNLGIPFNDLKSEMQKDGGSLGKAIKTLRPKANAEVEREKAEKQSDDDLKKTP